MMRKMIMATVCAMLGAVAFGEDNFKTLGAMIDVSRGRVYTVDYLKTRFDQMSKMGYNMVMLYTEDVFKLEGEPKWVSIGNDIDAFTNDVWTNLNEENKVSLFVRFIDIATGTYETRIVNKNQ